MEALFFNINNGYLEGIIRGYMGGMINTTSYMNLTQCETLEVSTDYGSLLQNEPSPISTSTISDRCNEKLVEEFEYIRSQASGNLAKFLDFITYGYMIDNVILLITGTLHERDTNELLERCHPLGVFESMPALCIATNVSELYNTVLVETPLDCLSATDLDEMNIEIIRNTLYKAYLEDFYNYCKTLSLVDEEIMGELLKFEADRRTINITINSFGTELSKDDRNKLFPNLGRLYPEGNARLARVDDFDQVRTTCEQVLEYRNFFDSSGVDSNKSLEDRFFEYEVELTAASFQQQFHFAGFYSYFRLKQQEIRNLVWIAECIAQAQKDKINNFIPTF